jgi:hypothetical protein
MQLTNELLHLARIPYVLRRVPSSAFGSLLPFDSDRVEAGTAALAEVTKIAKNAHLELSNGRRCALHEGDVIGVVFGNRYATLQFEGYARRDAERCDLLSMGGLCGLVESKHARIPDPTRLLLLGGLGDDDCRPLRLRDFRLPPTAGLAAPRSIVVCGSSMDAGKTHTVTSLIRGLQRSGARVAAIKLTGTATGKDTWNMLDAGACIALDFVDGGYPSTYQCSADELMRLYDLLVGHARNASADWVVVEIADGLLQQETAALLRHPQFRSDVDTWIFAAGDPMAAESGARMLRHLGIEPIGMSGVMSMSALSIREAERATGIRCYTADELQGGLLNDSLQFATSGRGTRTSRISSL